MMPKLSHPGDHAQRLLRIILIHNPTGILLHPFQGTLLSLLFAPAK